MCILCVSLLDNECVASPKGLGPEKDYAGEGQQHIQKRDPSKSNKYMVMSQDGARYQDLLTD
jgi:hypothetical protein